MFTEGDIIENVWLEEGDLLKRAVVFRVQGNTLHAADLEGNVTYIEKSVFYLIRKAGSININEVKK